MTRRVLLVNKFYYPRGGDCVVVLNTEALLGANGVDAEVFAMQYSQNLPAHYQQQFASQVSFSGTRKQQWQALRRTLGTDGGVVQRFEQVLDDYQPDVVHLHNIHSYLSPIVGQLAHQRGIRVVWTLHDYKLLCPRYDCLRGGKPCTLCYGGAKRNVVSHRCMRGSLPASAVAWLEAKKWNRDRLQRNTDLFVCPSRFMARQMRQGGYGTDKLMVLNNFIDPVKLQHYTQGGDAPQPQRQDYYCYVGRLSPEKGVDTLLQVASQLPYVLRVAGGGPMEPELRMQYAHCHNIEFVGMLDAPSVASLLQQARLSVVPSQWYENNPLSVTESLCAGTPVAGARIGGIPELLDDTCGIAFESGNADELAAAIAQGMQRHWDHQGIAAAARQRYSADTHYQSLMRAYGFE